MKQNARIQNLLRQARRRGLDAGTATHVDRAWEEEFGVPITKAIFISRGFADATLALIEDAEGQYHVGIGESMRPYEAIYDGYSYEDARDVFVEAAKEWIRIAKEFANE